MEVAVYTSQITNRLRYTFDLYFSEILGISYRFETDPETFLKLDVPKINYSHKAIGDELFFYATSLLFQKKVKEQEIEVTEHNGLPGFFSTAKGSVLPFDPFAAGFYLVSRYEEYLPHITDKFGRYPAEESLAYKEGFLKKPVVNMWALKVRELLEERFPDIEFPEKNYTFIPTYDIDSAYAYRHKGLVRTAGGYFRALFQADWQNIIQRTKVLLNLRKDPFNNFDWLHHLHNKYDLHPIYFFLVGNYGDYDKNISIHNLSFQYLIKSIADHASVGLHPSYASNYSNKMLTKEVNRLSSVLKREVTMSRQHFLKMKLPFTYQNLLNLEITDDYSMGYASKTGFRAGITTPFSFYDLESEIKTPLKVHPFPAMDATLRYYLNLSNEEAIEEVKLLLDEVKKVNGEFVFVSHNNSFSEESEWSGWRESFQEIIDHAVK